MTTLTMRRCESCHDLYGGLRKSCRCGKSTIDKIQVKQARQITRAIDRYKQPEQKKTQSEGYSYADTMSTFFDIFDSSSSSSHQDSSSDFCGGGGESGGGGSSSEW